MIAWLIQHWHWLLAAVLWWMVLFVLVWPQDKRGKLLNVSEAIDYYDHRRYEMGMIRSGGLCFFLFFACLWVLLIRRKYK